MGTKNVVTTENLPIVPRVICVNQCKKYLIRQLARLRKMNLDELEKLAKAATPGPWCFPENMKWMRQIFRQVDVDKVEHPRSGCPDHALATVHLQYCKDHSYPWEENARFIAACSPNVILALVARVKELEEALTSMVSYFSHDKTYQHETGELCPCKRAKAALSPSDSSHD